MRGVRDKMAKNCLTCILTGNVKAKYVFFQGFHHPTMIPEKILFGSFLSNSKS